MRPSVLFILAAMWLACRPLEPSDTPRKTIHSTLTIALSSQSLQLGEFEPAVIRYFFASKNEAPYTTRLYKFSYDPVTMVGLRVGPQQLQIEVLDDQDNVLARTAANINLDPGAQQFEKDLEFELRKLFRLRVELVSKEETQRSVTYRDIEPILQDPAYGCASANCHGFDNSEKVHMDLREFPFRSKKYNDNQYEIVSAIIARVDIPVGQGGRMPMGSLPSLVAEERDKLRQWANDGLMAEPPECEDPMNWVDHIVSRFKYEDRDMELTLTPGENREIWWEYGAFASKLRVEGSMSLVNQDGEPVMAYPFEANLSKNNPGFVKIEVPCEAHRGRNSDDVVID